MLKIVGADIGSARKLEHGKDVFHKALSYVRDGETLFYVSNPAGEDYGLAYEDNNSMIPGADT